MERMVCRPGRGEHMATSSNSARKVLKLSDNFIIEQDVVGWILKEARITVPSKHFKSPGGKTVWKATYHGTLEQALRAFVDDTLHGSSPEVVEILSALKDSRRAIEAVA